LGRAGKIEVDRGNIVNLLPTGADQSCGLGSFRFCSPVTGSIPRDIISWTQMNTNTWTGGLSAAWARKTGRSTPLAGDDPVELLRATRAPEACRPVDSVGCGHKQQHMNGQRHEPAWNGNPTHPGERVDIVPLGRTFQGRAHGLGNRCHVTYKELESRVDSALFVSEVYGGP
jgi:hypothetical protein